MALTKATYSMISNAPQNVVDFGADATGVSNSTSSFQNAIDLGGTIKVPAGSYLVDTLTVPSDTHIILDAGAIITKTAGTIGDDNNIFNVYGTVSGTSSTLTANVPLASLSISVTSASGFAVGDWCLLLDQTFISGSAGQNQEIVRIYDISGTTITLTGATIGTYATASSAALTKIVPKDNVIIEGGTLIVPTGASTGGGIATYLAVNSEIKNCQIYGANDNASIGVVTSYNISVHGNSCYDNQNISSGGYGYAYSIDNSHHVRLSNNHQEHVRESVATNRSRFIAFTGNTSNYSYDSHFNTHGSGNANVIISNNTCSGRGGIGYAVGYSGHTAGDSYVTISNNTSSGVNVCVAVGGSVGLENTDICITGNIASNCATTGRFSPITVIYVNGGAVSNNVVDGGNNANIVNGIIALSCESVYISGNSISNIPNGYGIVLDTSVNCVVTNNTCSNINSYDYRSVGTCTGSRIERNTADKSVVSIGADVATINNSWQAVQFGSAAPVSGTYIRGAVVYDIAPAAGGTLGWVCVASGTPGTWKTFGAISA